MLIGGTSDYNTAIKIAEGVAACGANIYLVRSAHTIDVIEVATPLLLAQRLEILKQDEREPVAVWVAGKRTK